MSSKIDLNMSIDIDNPVHIAAASAFFNALAGKEPELKPAPPAKKRRTKAEIDAEKTALEKGQDTEGQDTEGQDTEGQDTEVYKISEVRALLKLTTNKSLELRGLVKVKLTELGTNNVTELDPTKYTELMDYLKGLE